MDGPVAYIVDDVEANRQLIDWLLASVGVSTRSFDGGESFLEAFDETVPGCVLLDLRMPGLSGLELQRQLSNRGVAQPTIIVTAHGEVAAAVEAMKLGAYDFIEKPIQNQQLIDTVFKAFQLCERRLERRQSVAVIETRLASLSQREREVLDAIVAGAPNKQVAHDLGISARTVEVHRSNVMTKMKAGSIAELTRMVVSLDRLED